MNYIHYKLQILLLGCAKRYRAGGERTDSCYLVGFKKVLPQQSYDSEKTQWENLSVCIHLWK